MSNHNHNSLQFQPNENDFQTIRTPISVPTSLVDKQRGYSTICREVSDTSCSILGEITNIEVKTSSIKSDSTGIILPSSQQTDVVQQVKCDVQIGPKLVLQSNCKSKQQTDADADIFNEALKTEKVELAEELQFVLQEYDMLHESLCKKNTEERHDFFTIGNYTKENKTRHILSLLRERNKDFNIAEMQVRLEMITGNLEEAHRLNTQNQEILSNEGKLETNIRTCHLLEEVVAYQSQLMEKLCFMTEDNEKLRSEVAVKEGKIKEINAEWEKASLELTSFLLDGSKSLRDATNQIEYIAGSFAHVNIDIGEHIGNAAKYCVEKEEKILLLERSLEDAQKTVTQMEQNMISLRGAAIVFTELQEVENLSNKESIKTTTMLNDNKASCREAQIFKKHKSAGASLFEINMETDCTRIVLGDDEDYKNNGPPATMGTKHFFLLDHSEIQAGLLEKLPECDTAVNLSFAESEIGGHPPGEDSCSLGSHALNSKYQQGIKSGHNQFIMPEMIGILRPADLALHEADASCCSTMKLVADEKLSPECRFLIQFEEACASMQEAEIMINALLKANENSTLLTRKYKQSREILMVEKASLVEEIKQLKISLHLKDEENEKLHDQICDSLVDMSKMMALLEGSFLHMRTDTEAMCKEIYSDAFMLAKEIQSIIRFSRSSVEDIFAKVLEEEFTSFVLHQFSLAADFKDYRNLDALLTNHPDRFQDCLNNQLLISMIDDKVETSSNSEKGEDELDHTAVTTAMEAFEMGLTLDDKVDNNSELQKEFEDSYIEQLEEKGEDIKTFEEKVDLAKLSLERQLLSSLEKIENDLRNVTEERDQLCKQVVSLQDRLSRATALTSENEASAVKAHKEVEASKIRTEQREEEVKILKQLVKELEGTINVLEKKGYEMEEEVRRHHQIQQDLSKIEFPPQWQRPLNSTSHPAQDQLIRELHCRSLELHEAHNQISTLEAELAEQSKEMKWCKGYISELVLHAEAQASQYQQKYKTLEAMVREVKTESSNLAFASPNVDKTEKKSTRTRRSSSPFRCMMGGLVQQKTLVKDQELSTALLRIHELEELLVSRQKEVCLLNTRLAATENMTHDIIRDLLGVKLDMTNYANMMDHHQFQKIVKDTQQQTHSSRAMEKEILKMRRQINDLIEERDICIIEVNRREADICAIQMDVEQIQEREQLLTAENVLLKTEKTNLHRRVAELDNMVKRVFGTQANQPRVQQQIDCLLKSSSTDFRERPINSEKQVRGVNNEVSQYFKPESSHTQANLRRRLPMAMTKDEKSKLRVLMSPFLGYGHIMPFVELAKKLSETNDFYSYLCSTPANLNSIRTKLSTSHLSSIELVELHLQSSPELPPHFHTTNGLPEHLHDNLYKAFKMSQPDFLDILKNTKPHLVLYDAFQPWVPDMAASLGIPAVYFHISSAVSTAFLYSFVNICIRGEPFPFPAIFLRPGEIKRMLGTTPVDPTVEDPVGPCLDKSNGYILTKSCNDVEEKYLVYLSELTNKKVIPVGLLNDQRKTQSDETDDSCAEMIKWLDSKEKASTVYVSFGSETFLSNKDITDLAFGLEKSGANFLWFIRFPSDDGTNIIKIEDVLPKGFIDRVKGRGMVLEGWSPQQKILGHASVGVFFGHSGWSSVIESLSFGVPVIGLPMKSDQPLNARVLVELGVALEVERDNNNLDFTREDVAKVIKEVMDSKSSVRMKAKKLSEKIKINEDQVIAAAVEQLKNICTKNMK
ncbi:hypothetical protein POM88_018503 [Heracleum sosnowskyi]|uniref:UDP-glycosyltransferases domain-containing protein n=1 Tax=Heracleum sosnowskyi TaxID=360622 RepID=A0AAD8IUK2_9APIA|nr:hypothetical protein POM88_018503 [Heracleum sosnowskyi]